MPPRLAIAGLTASRVMRGLDLRIQGEMGLGKSAPSQLGRPVQSADQVRRRRSARRDWSRPPSS